jgi:hypothetical protein
MSAGILVLDALVRPVFRRVIPTTIIVRFGERDDRGCASAAGFGRIDLGRLT